MVEKYEPVIPEKHWQTGKWTNISSICKFNNENVILNQQGSPIKIDEHYFFVRDELGEHKSIFGDRLTKKSFDSYSMMWNVKKNQYDWKDLFESNLKPVRRWLIDNVEVPMNKVPLNKFYFDIENDMSLDVDNTPKPITSISTFSNKLMRVVNFIWREDFEPRVEKFGENEYLINKESNKYCPYPVSVRYYNNEYDMLSDFLEMTEQVRADLYLHWSGNYFDFPYLINRSHKLGLDPDKLSLYGVKLDYDDYTKKLKLEMQGSFSLDMLDGYKLMTANDLNSYSLKNCANDILGETKLEIELKDAWRIDPEALMRYNTQDTLLLIDIDDAIGMVDFFDEKRRSVGCEWDDVFLNSKLLDVWFIRKAKAQGFHLPDPKYGFNKGGFIGAFVVDPISGLYEWVLALDLSSLYPNIIIQFNISNETIIEGIDYDIDIGMIKLQDKGLPNYKKPREKVGFLPMTIEELQVVRKNYKKKMYSFDPKSIEYKLWDNKQFVTKSTINSIYGVLGYDKFRLYDKRLAESVTVMGQEVIKWSGDIIRKEGYEVVYGDTDSTYVKVQAKTMEEAVEIGKKLRDKINASYTEFVQKFGCDENTNLEMEFEAVMKKMFIAGDAKGKGLKKRYAYEQVWKDGKENYSIGFKGFEVVRSNASPVTKKVQKELFRILFDDNIEKQDKKKIFETWLNDFKKNLREMKYNYDFFTIPQTIKQRLQDYKITNPSIRSAEYANTHMNTNITVDTKIRLLYLKGLTNMTHTNEICYTDEKDFKEWLEENNIELLIDWDLMIEKLIDDKISNIYKNLKWADVGQNTLPF